MFGLTNTEGNHGEDVKEYYFHLDNTPTHSYMKFLYKYPQGAKAGPEDLLVEITAHNRGPDEATLHLLPTIWFRHTWSWAGGTAVPGLRQTPGAIRADHEELGPRWLYHDTDTPTLFTDNETNNERVFGSPNTTPYVKDGIDRHVVHGEQDAVNPERTGTKAAVHHVLTVPGEDSVTIRLRLTDTELTAPWGDFGQVLDLRRTEADTFYDVLAPDGMGREEKRMVRQALAGMLWSKQYYYLDVQRWLAEHGVDPLAADPNVRNSGWYHMVNDEIMSMPDTWEYPWFAAWDLAFHTLPLAMVDIGFAKSQLDLLLHRLCLHPNGQIPAYEWNFGDVNPPVHAWATLFVYELEKHRTGQGDRAFLENAYQKLLKNFTWWLNRKDVDGNNVFQGGFLGLDNIGVFDRSAPLPTGGHLDQADGTAWMALYCQNLMDIAIELAVDNPVYVEQAQMLFEHFAWIAVAMNRIGKDNASLWDEEDGFFYDVLRLPDGSAIPLKVRSLVGLIPLAATSVIGGRADRSFPELVEGAQEFIRRHPAVEAFVSQHAAGGPSAEGRYLFALFGEDRLRRILARMLDEDEFLGPHGIRSLSRHHAEHPYTFDVHGQTYGVGYLPAESDSGMFGGNSNWRGPVWFPINLLLIRALMNLHGYHGPDFTVECPTGSGRRMNLYEVAREISDRLTSTFLPDPDGHRPVHGAQPKFAKDPHWKDLILFYEYFHGDNGAGLGAAHQTGWSGLVAATATLFHVVGADDWHRGGRDFLRPTDDREEPLS
ncbi:hypothetical protein QFZ76_001595 [Streptomyces sp. V4I2]|nr:hypothetical protein [Streptomyces sp. V4I2]